VQRLIADNRDGLPNRQIRLKIDREATVFASGRSLAVTLRDISQQGACIECPDRLMLRQSLSLEVPGFPTIFAKVCWRQSPRHGLVFDKGFMLEETARYLAKLHHSGSATSLRAAG
jgi:hypothetical protein